MMYGDFSDNRKQYNLDNLERYNLKNYFLFALKYTTCCPINTFKDDIGTNKIFNTLDYIEII